MIKKFWFSEIDITPTQFNKIQLGGYRKIRDFYTDNVIDNISIILFSYIYNSTQYCIISIDTLWIDELFYQDCLEIVNKNLKIGKAQILITATHTHSSPYLSKKESFYGKPNLSFIQEILQKIEDELKNIKLEDCKDSKIGYIKNTDLVCNRNRIFHSLIKNKKTVVRSPSKKLEKESRIRFLKLVSNNDKEYYLLNFSCHPTFNQSNSISADFPGEIRKKFKPASVLFLQGFAGDQKANIKNYLNKFTLKRLLDLRLIPKFSNDINKFIRKFYQYWEKGERIKSASKVNKYQPIILEKFLKNNSLVRLQRIPIHKGIFLISINAEPSYYLAEELDQIDFWPVGYSNGMIGYLFNPKISDIDNFYEKESWKNFNCEGPYSTEDILLVKKYIHSLIE